MSKRGGYRVTSIQSDVVLGQKWALIASCDHPEWPTLALQMYGSNPLPSTLQTRQRPRDGISATPVVHAGDPVRLWKQEDLLRIEIAGISEESGSLGNRIRVRLLHRNTDDQAMQEQFSGIIRGPSDVEMQP
jgi:Chaperone for flagella basal body P-ring formation